MKQEHIEETLKDLCTLYDQYSSEDQKIYYFSKLAILELCGWIEFVVDEAIKKHFAISSETIQKDIMEVIRRCNGFKYTDHIRPLIRNTLGANNIEKIEQKLDSDLDIIRNTLGSLSTLRDRLAHTFKMSNTIKIDAPTATLKNFYTIKSSILKLAKLIVDLSDK